MSHPTAPASVGVFGGSGFYSLLDDVELHTIDTPYGAPSDRVAIATVGERRVAFLPRHGAGHTHPAHAVNYRANVAAFHQLGVREIIAPCACGSLQSHLQPGEFVILDQFVDRTRGRRDTFFDGPETHHIGAATPYCERLRTLARDAAEAVGIVAHPAGTMVVIQGPRFSTRAESAWFTRLGWDVVGMTQYPEGILARELGMCYTGIALVTDWDAGVLHESGGAPVSVEEVLRVFHDNVERVKDLILALAPKLGGDRSCDCAAEAERAQL